MTTQSPRMHWGLFDPPDCESGRKQTARNIQTRRWPQTIAFTGVGQSTATTTDAGDRETVRDFAHKVCVTLLSVVVAGNFCGKRVAATESETQHVRTAQRQQLVWRVAPDRCCFTPPPPFPSLSFPFFPSSSPSPFCPLGFVAR